MTYNTYSIYREALEDDGKKKHEMHDELLAGCVKSHVKYSIPPKRGQRERLLFCG
jgi:hypothetical protein